MAMSIDSTKAALVAQDVYWLPIDKDTPLGVKLLVINKTHGVLTTSTLGPNEKYFTHYQAMPKFAKDFSQLTSLKDLSK